MWNLFHLTLFGAWWNIQTLTLCFHVTRLHHMEIFYLFCALFYIMHFSSLIYLVSKSLWNFKIQFCGFEQCLTAQHEFVLTVTLGRLWDWRRCTRISPCLSHLYFNIAQWGKKMFQWYFILDLTWLWFTYIIVYMRVPQCLFNLNLHTHILGLVLIKQGKTM